VSPPGLRWKWKAQSSWSGPCHPCAPDPPPQRSKNHDSWVQLGAGSLLTGGTSGHSTVSTVSTVAQRHSGTAPNRRCDVDWWCH
jgi:hypothetical protein